ncbi:MAG TPA: SDR family NAD(P)-dependent oxidoreductase, partial [Sphingomonadaceae bacterium]|nr:SDR family NAD(P)-dependent oxidoreductase [Sphingomonadaceae bacterium]
MRKLMELFSVEGQAALVTGGASGIGLGYAEAMAANGAAVTLLDLDGAKVEREVARLREAGFTARGAVVDVT